MITGFYCLVDFVAHLACWKSLACGTMFFMKVEEEGGKGHSYKPLYYWDKTDRVYTTV